MARKPRAARPIRTKITMTQIKVLRLDFRGGGLSSSGSRISGAVVVSSCRMLYAAPRRGSGTYLMYRIPGLRGCLLDVLKFFKKNRGADCFPAPDQPGKHIPLCRLDGFGAEKVVSPGD